MQDARCKTETTKDLPTFIWLLSEAPVSIFILAFRRLQRTVSWTQAATLPSPEDQLECIEPCDREGTEGSALAQRMQIKARAVSTGSEVHVPNVYQARCYYLYVFSSRTAIDSRATHFAMLRSAVTCATLYFCNITERSVTCATLYYLFCGAAFSASVFCACSQCMFSKHDRARAARTWQTLSAVL